MEVDERIILSTSPFLQTDTCSGTLTNFIRYYQFLASQSIIIITKEESELKIKSIEDFLESEVQSEEKIKQFHQDQIMYITSIFSKITDGKENPTTIFWQWFKKCQACIIQGGGVGFSFKYKIQFFEYGRRLLYSPPCACLPPDRKDLFPTLKIHMAAIITGQEYELSNEASHITK
jgi:hypothetical protein